MDVREGRREWAHGKPCRNAASFMLPSFSVTTSRKCLLFVVFWFAVAFVSTNLEEEVKIDNNIIRALKFQWQDMYVGYYFQIEAKLHFVG